MATQDLACGVALLRKSTDACASLADCRRPTVDHRACSSAPESHRRLVQSGLGVLRRTYAQLAEQHPSVPLPLDEAISRAGASAELVVVVSRCREPLQPLLRLVPAFGGGGAVRVVVYERCVAGAHLSELPALDVRDRLFGVRRVVFSEAGSAQAAFAAHAAAAPAAAATLYGVGRGCSPRSRRRCRRRRRPHQAAPATRTSG